MADYYMDNDNLTNYAPYGANNFGTPFRPDGSPINYAGDGNSYLAHGGSQAGFDPTGQADHRAYADSIAHDGGWSTGGSWAGDGDGGSGGSGGGFSGANPYAEAQRLAEQARRAQIEAGVGVLNEQRPLVNQSYDDAARQAYAAYRLQQNRMPGQLSSFATGMADTLALRGTLGYENGVQQTERERANALSGIDNDIAQLRLSGDASIAQEASKYAQMAVQYQQEQEQRAYQRAMEQKQFAAAAQQRELENNLNQRKLALQEWNAQSGVTQGQASLAYDHAVKNAKALAATGDYSGYLALGWTQEQVHQANRSFWSRAKPGGTAMIPGGDVDGLHVPFQGMVLDFYNVTNQLANQRKRQPHLEEIRQAAQELAKQGVPTRQILAYGSAFGVDLRPYLKE